MSDFFDIEELHKKHDRAQFTCGVTSLDTFLHRYANQNRRADFSRTFVAVCKGQARVFGYYSISAGQIDLAHVEDAARYPNFPMPVVRLGRLAVDRSVQKKGLGEQLLLDALARTQRVATEMGIAAVEVHAIHEQAREFYTYYGFQTLLDDDLHLYLPIKTIRKLGL